MLRMLSGFEYRECCPPRVQILFAACLADWFLAATSCIFLPSFASQESMQFVVVVFVKMLSPSRERRRRVALPPPSIEPL